MNQRMRFHSRLAVFAAAAALSIETSFGDELQLLWQKSVDEGLPYLGTANTDRGVAINPATGNILVVSRATVANPGEVYILDGETGEQVGVLSVGSDPGLIAGGIYVQNLIGIADDGVIYVANLTTSTTSADYRVYRWENEEAQEPTLAYTGDPSGGDPSAVRWGDSFDVRGSGTDTQFFAGAGSSATIGALFTTADGLEFTPTVINNISANAVAFGEGNSVWVKRSSQALRLVAFDVTTGVGTDMEVAPTSAVPGTALPLGVNAEGNLLGVINVTTSGVDDFRLYDVGEPDDVFIIDQENFPADNANANAAGSVDIRGDIVAALDTNNGLVVYRIVESISPPNFTTQPTALSILEGGFASLVASVAGTQPITFQWQLNGVDVPGGTNSTLVFTNITAAEGGTYTLIASNAALAVTSNPAEVTIEASVRTDFATVLWKLEPGSRSYITPNNTERGVAYNVLSNHVLVVSRTDGVNVHVLNGDTGADLWKLQVPTDVIPAAASTPGGFRLNVVGVADDGAVYAANLTTAAGEGDANAFRIYRWENDGADTLPVEVYRGAPISGRRFGDSFDVRGAGDDTQILLGNNNPGAAEPDNMTVIMTTADGGLSWTPNVITTPGVDDDYFRLSVAFGSGDTIWGKTTGQALHEVGFDITTGVGTLSNAFAGLPNLSSAISVSSNLIALLSLENPDNLRIYEKSAAGDQITLRDQEFFAANNANPNGTGAVDFGTNRVYAIDTHNGLIALQINGGGGGGTTDPATFGTVSGNATSLTFVISGTAGTTYQIEGTTDFETWEDVQSVQIEGDGSNEVTINNTAAYRFFRAVAE